MQIKNIGLFALLFLTSHISIFCISPSDKTKLLFSSEQNILASYFRSLFENTMAGYVFYGDKPVYLGGSCAPEKLIPGTERHKKAIHELLALKVLSKLNLNQNHPIFMGRKEKGPLIILNRKAFCQAIADNLILFKYKLGYDASPKTILEKFITFDPYLWEVLNKETSLQGITLGYGADNAISCERFSFLTKNIFPSKPIPPEKLPMLWKNRKEHRARIEKFSQSDLESKKINEETKDFDNHYLDDSNLQEMKIFFAFHKNSIETKNLLRKYKQAHQKLSHVLSDENFFDLILKKLGMTNQTLLDKSQSITYEIDSSQKENLCSALAKSIQSTFLEPISPDFIQGMRDAENKKKITCSDWEKLIFFESLRRETKKEDIEFFHKKTTNAEATQQFQI